MKVAGVLFLISLSPVIWSCASKPLREPRSVFEAVSERNKPVRSMGPLLVNNLDVAARMKPLYGRQDLESLEAFLATSLQIRVNERGLVQAADRELGGEKDDTNYDAIWLRDSLWVYLGLEAQESGRGQPVLRTLLQYMSSSDQIQRIENLIADPSLLSDSMAVPHIRFDGRSESFQDVYVAGKPQSWNHRQNDALGLFYDLTLRALEKNEILLERLTEADWRLLTRLPCYFERVRFFEMEDAGPWEEIDRVNSSSVGLVTSGLEQLLLVLRTKSDLAKAFSKRSLAYKGCAQAPRIQRLVSLGYKRIKKQLALGGESPDYPKGSSKYREADAALFNLIYPARLPGLSLQEKEKILLINRPLIGQVGIRRYLYDSYQSGNFWLKESESQKTDSRTDDTSSEASFAQRGSKFIEGTEAQWFFDSWLSLVYGRLYAETKITDHLKNQIFYLNRSLAQITGGSYKSPWLAADGRAVPPMGLPESYNTLLDGPARVFVPSPITPLNWAKASLILALKELQGQSN